MSSLDRIRREVGVMAGRLATLLDGVAPDEQAGSRDFLRSHPAGAPLAGPPLPGRLERLISAFGISRAETDLLILAGMAEEHEGFASVFRTLHPRGESRPSAGLAAQLLAPTPQARLQLRGTLESGRAASAGVLRLAGDAPFFERSIELAPGLWAALEDMDAWPPELPLIAAEPVTAGLEDWLASPAATRAAAALRADDRSTVLVTADQEDVAFHRALALAAAAGASPAGFAVTPETPAALRRLISVHAAVREVTPVIRCDPGSGPAVAEAPDFAFHPGAVVLAARTGTSQSAASRPLLALAVQPLVPAARRRMWGTLMPALAAGAPALAARYPIEPSIAAAVATDLTLLESIEGRAPTAADAAAAIRARSVLPSSGGVKLITPTAGWDDLVLSPERMAVLREAISRLQFEERVVDQWGFLKNRPGARGVRMLFTGPPGTGKTLSAEVMAHALSVDLLYVDISRVVSKWIGETEKNLSAVFDTAERAHAVLLFDEADALFGKRTEVSDAHDRYANLETAYLLSRLERFEGLAILASNLRRNIDPAFLRRVEFSIDFEPPDRAERLTLWKVHLPAAAPLAGDVDLEELAALYAVPGAFIRNSAVAAAYLAAANGGVICRSHFLHAIRREYEKSGRAFPGT